MNFWKENCIPFFYTPANCTTNWYINDNLENFQKNPNKDKWNDINISYRISNEGFRTYDFDTVKDKTIDIALGCSQTLGEGVAAEMSWPSLIEQQTASRPVLNLGRSGASSDTVANILVNVAGLFKIDTVYILWPYVNRFDLYQFDKTEYIQPHNCKSEHVWNMFGQTAENRYHKNKLIVEYLAKLHDFKIVDTTVEKLNTEFKEKSKDRARDGRHYGITMHKIIADQLLTRR
jgi:hypothetical protein